MSKNAVAKQILRDYENDRNHAKKLLEGRRQEVYNRSPRVKEIDELLVQSTFTAAKTFLSGVPQALESAKDENSRLLAEKGKLIEGLGISDDYFTNIFKCKLCNDTGFVGTEKCSCFKQKMIAHHYSISNLGAILERENFESFDFQLYSEDLNPQFGLSPAANIRKIYTDCMDFVLNFRSEFSNLLFYGNTGLGKTFLCNAIAKDLLNTGTNVLYVAAPRIFKKIEDFRFKRNEQESPDEQLELIYDAELLIIDDLGSEISTSITVAELFNIINTRLIDNRATIISTNLSIEDFRKTYTERISSRILGNYNMLLFFGQDIRLKKKITIHR